MSQFGSLLFGWVASYTANNQKNKEIFNTGATAITTPLCMAEK